MQYVCGQMSRAAQKRNPGRGSQRLHRALGGTRILLAAAPTAPPCFCRWQRSSLLLFESTRPISLALLQNKNLSVLAYAEAFWWARVDYASRAAKNSPLGCFYAVFCDSAAAVRIHPPYEFSLVTKQKPQRTCIRSGFLVGAGGFEPPKLKAADLQSVPIGHSGTRPYSVVVHPCAGRLVYFSMRKGFCQPPFFTFFQQAYCPPPAALHPVELRPVLC